MVSGCLLFMHEEPEMYAVIRAAGKQFKVAQGDVIRLPLMAGEVGESIEFGDVLHIGGDSPKLGSPLVADAKVTAKVLRHARDKKIIVYKFKRRQGYEKRRGHRQDFTEVRIEDIAGGK